MELGENLKIKKLTKKIERRDFRFYLECMKQSNRVGSVRVEPVYYFVLFCWLPSGGQ
jgi:hypothetical protein